MADNDVQDVTDPTFDDSVLKAEMPVLVRSLASIGTQNAVSKRELFCETLARMKSL